ncbi:MAG: phosphate signaling complex protein PhoU [Acidobacteriaceae bacterium]|nr:phosphate signaling complex protein PhoU [Acidobacteriaceae bacterium]
MPRIHFQQQLAELKEKLLAMAKLAQRALETSVEAYLGRDEALAEEVERLEAGINAAEREVYEMAYELLAKEQPMAIDLRFIFSVIKINADLERVGDQSINISERVATLREYPLLDVPEDVSRIRKMGEHAGRMISISIQALLEADAHLAETILTMDDEIDAMNMEAQTSMMQVMENDPSTTIQALNAIIVARNLERAADHATNIAEDVIFWVRGSDVRHRLSLVDAD